MEVKAIKKYGQNFLKSAEVLNKISNSVDVLENDLIIEIGPGMGALTNYLVKKKANLLCYEIDSRMSSYLDSFSSDKCQIIYADFLKRNVIEDIKKIKYNNLYVIANIPYYITSSIISKLIEMELKPKEIVLLVQKEFAERITANENHKEYNAFTLYVDFYYHSKLLFYVDKTNFIPVPKVDSAVIKLTRKEDNGVNNKDFYFKFIKDAFQNKRKTLKNNLKNYNWHKIKTILMDLGYKETVRAEEICKKDFKTLANKYEWEKM